MEFNTEQLDIIFPFHALVNESLCIINFGAGLKKISPAIENNKKLNEFLILRAPSINFTFGDIVQKKKQLFLFSVEGKAVQLKGQALCFNDSILFILSPVITDSSVLKEFGITIRDFAIYDSMADTIFLLNAQKMALNESKQFSSRLLETNQKLEKVNKEIAEINEHLEQKVAERTREIQNTLTELKSTQAQLIQSEKMASLGELTAGIAHEIQNPLNFVNNFSEVNADLIEELQGERSKVTGERNEQLENEIINDIKDNEQKIIHHGKRADAIVKSMLQHSRQSKSVKEPTDINALCDKYLHLSYHGMRAKDKNFNATLQTHFDETIGKINVVPQDIGRVLLNVYNNAFYATSSKLAAHGSQPGPYVPNLTVITENLNDSIEIRVIDNGAGIPSSIIDKIFQPFFTTKPTGEGTGLGLSLAYDIIKAHGGEINVTTKEGEKTEFIIRLPIQHYE